METKRGFVSVVNMLKRCRGVLRVIRYNQSPQMRRLAVSGLVNLLRFVSLGGPQDVPAGPKAALEDPGAWGAQDSPGIQGSFS